jgi:hypothetical protein
MADAIDAAQGRSKVARPNEPGSQDVQSSDIPPATFDRLGPDRHRVVKRLELRRADEIDAPQDGGEVASPAGDRDSIARTPGIRNRAASALPSSSPRRLVA